MNLLVEIALKTAAIFLIALATTTVLRRHSAALRHHILAVAFLAAAAAPVLTIWAPQWRVPVPESWLRVEPGAPVRFAQGQVSSSVVSISPARPDAPAPARASTSQIVLALWVGGALMGVAGTFAGMWRVGRFARGARPLHQGAWRDHADDIAALYGVGRSVQLLHSAHPTMLVTWGLVRPRILLPVDAPGWSDDRIRIVLYHELAHVQRRDWAMLIGARLLRALYWFNPFVWIAFRRLRQESEHACDDVVLGRGVIAADYASHLLAVARETVLHRNWSAAAAIAHPSTLEGRIRAMLNERQDRSPLNARGRWSAVIVASVGGLAVAGAGLSAVAAPDSVIPLPPAAQSAAQPSPPEAKALDPRLDRADATIEVAGTRLSAARLVADAPAAQVAPGAISGVLYDPLGGLLPGVQVRLTRPFDGATYDTTSDRNGAFLFTALPVGDYHLNTSLPGFATVSNLIKVVAGATAERAITLPIGTLEETITVTGGDLGAAPVVDPLRIASTLRRVTPRARSAPEPRTLFSGGIGGQIRVPQMVFHVKPLYPADAIGSDAVVLMGRVGIDGFISDLREAPSENATAGARASHAAFVSSALDAIKQWEFTPVLLNNVPMEANITIHVYFSGR